MTAMKPDMASSYGGQAANLPAAVLHQISFQAPKRPELGSVQQLASLCNLLALRTTPKSLKTLIPKTGVGKSFGITLFAARITCRAAGAAARQLVPLRVL